MGSSKFQKFKKKKINLKIRGESQLLTQNGLPWVSDGKEFACNAGDLSLIPGSGRSPRKREWLSTPVFLPGKSQGERSPVGYTVHGVAESDTTE